MGWGNYPYWRSRIRPFFDRPDIEVPVLWYPAHEGAPSGPPSVFVDRFWDNMERWEPDGVGTVPSSFKVDLVNRPDFPPGPSTGTPDQWVNGVSYVKYLAGEYADPAPCFPIVGTTVVRGGLSLGGSVEDAVVASPCCGEGIRRRLWLAIPLVEGSECVAGVHELDYEEAPSVGLPMSWRGYRPASGDCEGSGVYAQVVCLGDSPGAMTCYLSCTSFDVENDDTANSFPVAGAICDPLVVSLGFVFSGDVLVCVPDGTEFIAVLTDVEPVVPPVAVLGGLLLGGSVAGPSPPVAVLGGLLLGGSVAGPSPPVAVLGGLLLGGSVYAGVVLGGLSLGGSVDPGA